MRSRAPGLAGLSFLLLTLLQGCGLGSESRSLDYFTLEIRSAAAPVETAQPSGLAIAVERFRAPEIFDDTRIALRDEARIQHFKFIRWAGPPPDLVQGVFVHALEQTGQFAWVDRSEAGRSGSCFLLQGEIRELSIQKSPAGEGWEARLEVCLRLMRTGRRAKPEAGSDGPRSDAGLTEPLKPWRVEKQWQPLHITAPPEAAPPKAEGDAGTSEVIKALVGKLAKELEGEAGKVAQEVVKIVKGADQGGE